MGRVNGNIQGIKDTLLERIELLYDMRQGQDEFVSREMVAELSQLTGILGREISIYIGRDGRIADVSVGDSAKVGRKREQRARYRLRRAVAGQEVGVTHQAFRHHRSLQQGQNNVPATEDERASAIHPLQQRHRA